MTNPTIAVPLDLLQRLQYRLDPHKDARDWGMVYDILAQPAGHSGQPSAAQSAPAGEREAFEEWMREEYAADDDMLQKSHEGRYFYAKPANMWDAWKARAAWQRTQSAGVPDVSAMARVLSDRSADACNIDRADNWAMYGQEYIEDVQAMLAAPAQQAAQEICGCPGTEQCGAFYDHNAKRMSCRAMRDGSCPGPAAQDQGEVQRLREALEGVVKRCSKEHGGSGYVGQDGQYLKVIDAALAASTGQEVER